MIPDRNLLDFSGWLDYTLGMNEEKSMHRVRLGDVAETVFPGLLPYGRSPVGKGDLAIPLISVKDLRDGTIDSSALDHYTVQDAGKILSYRVHSRDLIISTRGTTPKSAVCDESVEGLVAGPNLAVIRLKPDSPIGPYLLHTILESPAGQLALIAQSQGSATLGLRPKAIADLVLDLPPADRLAKLEGLCREFIGYRRVALEAIQTRQRIVHNLAGHLVTGE